MNDMIAPLSTLATIVLLLACTGCGTPRPGTGLQLRYVNRKSEVLDPLRELDVAYRKRLYPKADPKEKARHAAGRVSLASIPEGTVVHIDRWSYFRDPTLMCSVSVRMEFDGVRVTYNEIMTAQEFRWFKRNGVFAISEWNPLQFRVERVANKEGQATVERQKKNTLKRRDESGKE